MFCPRPASAGGFSVASPWMTCIAAPLSGNLPILTIFLKKELDSLGLEVFTNFFISIESNYTRGLPALTSSFPWQSTMDLADDMDDYASDVRDDASDYMVVCL